MHVNILTSLVAPIILFTSLSAIACFENFRFDSSELTSKFYDVSILSEPLLASLINDDQKNVFIDATDSSPPASQRRSAEFFTISNKKGRSYVCTLPHATNDEDMKSELERRQSLLDNLTMQEVDKVLTENLKQCLQKNTGWWTYEFCNSEEIVTQFHPDPNTLKVEKEHKISLGRLDYAFKWNISAQNRSYVEQKLPLYYEKRYVDGDTCELTSKPRKTKIQFYCDEDAILPELRLIAEDETCSYIMHVYTKGLCVFEAFLPETPETLSNEIACRPTVDEYEMEIYKKKQEDAKAERVMTGKDKLLFDPESLSVDEKSSRNWDNFEAIRNEKLQSDQLANSFRGTIQNWIRSFEMREDTSKAITFKTYIDDLIRKEKQRKKKANADNSELSLKDLGISFAQMIEKLEKEIEETDLMMTKSKEPIGQAEKEVTNKKRRRKKPETFVIDTKFSFEDDIDEEKVLKEADLLQKQLNEKIKDQHSSLQGKLKVEIATAYYDPKKKKYHVLKSGPLDSFGGLIYNLFGGRTARNEEEERYTNLVQNYDFDIED